jgi:hypothetical protein
MGIGWWTCFLGGSGRSGFSLFFLLNKGSELFGWEGREELCVVGYLG